MIVNWDGAMHERSTGEKKPLVVSDNSTDIQTTNPPLHLPTPTSEWSYEWWIWKHTIQSQIFGKSTIHSNGVLTWTTLYIPAGCYELKAINAEIIHICGNSELQFFQMSIHCNVYCNVSFDVPSSLVSVFGFKQDIVYGVGHHASENLVNIMSENSILVHCNIIHSSYMRGTQAPVAYNFFQNAAPRQNILEAPHNLIYLPVTVDIISTLSVWQTDKHGKLLDLRGEESTIRFHLRER